MSEYFVLKDREVVPSDVMTWAKFFEDFDNRVVAKTKVGDDVEVSTVFLGSNHRFGEGPPLVFETMVFGGELDEEMMRYSTYDEAEAGHKAMVARVEERQ